MILIRNYEDWSLNEGKYYQKELNPTFWSEEKEFDPEVREKLLKIAKEFYKSLELKAPIQDIELTGSMANYNWTRYSDLDVHILIDFTEINDDKDLVKKAIDGQRFMWNLRNNIVIRKHDVELYVQDIKEPHIASGLYSLQKNDWIRVPKFDPPEIDEKDVQKKFEGIVNDIDQMEEKLKEKKDSMDPRELFNHGEKLKAKIMKMRKEGLDREGEMSVENLVFKQLRNEGYMEKLIDLIAKAYANIYNE